MAVEHPIAVVEGIKALVGVRVEERIITLVLGRPVRVPPAPRHRHLDVVATGKQVVEEVVTVRIGPHRGNRVAVRIGCLRDRVIGEQRDLCPGDTGLTRILHTVLVQVPPDKVADTNDGRHHAGVDGSVDELGRDVRVGIHHLSLVRAVPRETEYRRLGDLGIGLCRGGVGIQRRVRALQSSGPGEPSREREAHLVVPGRKVDEVVVAIRVGCRRAHRNAVLVVRQVAVLVEQLDGHAIDTLLAVVLHAVLVVVPPHVVAHGQSEAVDAQIDGRVPECRSRQRIGLGDRAVVIPGTVARRVVRSVPDRPTRHGERVGKAVPVVAPVVHIGPLEGVRVLQWVVSCIARRPRRQRPPRRQDDAHPVPAGQQVVELVVPVRVGGHRCDGVTVGVGCLLPLILRRQLDRGAGHARLARILHTVTVQVVPDEVADTDNRGQHAGVECEVDHPTANVPVLVGDHVARRRVRQSKHRCFGDVRIGLCRRRIGVHRVVHAL